MKRENINYLVVGSFVLIIMAAFFAFLYQITGTSGPKDKYYVTYENVSGIKYGTPVSFEGYQLGQVENIVPIRKQGKTHYRLSLLLEKDWPIPADSEARIVASGLLAAITIDIREGTSDRLLEPESEINGREAANIFAAVTDVATNIQDLSQNSIKPLIDNLNQQINTISNQFTDLTTHTVKPMLENISSQIEQSNMVNKVDNLIGNLNKTSEDLQNVFNDENQQNISHFLNNMSDASSGMNDLVENIDSTRKAMDILISNIDNVIGDVNYMLENNDGKLNESLTDLQKTLSIISTHIDTITHHLEGSSRNIHEFTRQIKENPGLLIRSSSQTDKAE